MTLVSIRKMQETDLSSLMDLKSAEGWNQTEQDWKLLMSYPDSVNLVAIVSERIVGSVTGINYSGQVAWIGMMLVDKAFRGRGVARKLMQSTIDLLKTCRTIKLDATPAGYPVYAKIGFERELTLLRMTHPGLPLIVEGSDPGVAIQSKDIPEIIEYDKQVFGANRGNLIRHLYGEAPELAFCVRSDQQLTGFCLGRAGSRFTQVGPLYATSLEVALTLVKAVLTRLSGKACVVDIHADKKELVLWLTQAGFITARFFERMYLTENNYPGRVQEQYFISGPELG